MKQDSKLIEKVYSEVFGVIENIQKGNYNKSLVDIKTENKNYFVQDLIEQGVPEKSAIKIAINNLDKTIEFSIERFQNSFKI
jgi:hypothetical protein